MSSISVCKDAIVIPAPPGSNIDIGPVSLHMYGLILGIGIIAAFRLLELTLPRLGVQKSDIVSIAMPAVVLGLIGGRLYHVISQPVYYANHPVEILMIWKGGLGIYGSIAFGMLSFFIVGKLRKISGWDLIDACAGATAVAQGIGRWGNYVNQELFGKPTDLPWALHVDRQFRPSGFEANPTFHPTFLYESIWNISLGIALIVLFRRWSNRPRGAIICIYVAAYSFARFFIEGLRIDEAHAWHGLRQNEWVAAALFAVALLGLAATFLSKRRSEAVISP